MKSLFILSLISFLFWGGLRIYNGVQAERTYLGYLKRAADANSIDLAKQELKKAITEIERQGLTSGYTSIMWTTPDEELSFWHNNLTKSLKDLEDLPANSSPLEISNMLMKLRETLLDKDEVTYPSGINIFPYNTAYCWWACISTILGVLFFILWERDE